jgi:hypothetical protein
MELRCSICGGSQAATPRAVDEGWLECVYCGELSPVPGAGVFVATAPGGRVAEISQPGRRTLVVHEESRDPGSSLALLLLLDFAGAACLGLTRWIAPSAIWWIGIPLYAAIVFLVHRRRGPGSGKWHLRIEDDRSIEVQRVVRGRRPRLVLPRTTLSLLRARKEDADVLGRPSLFLHRSGRGVVRVPFASAADRDWALPRLVASARLTTRVDLGEELRCDGCGSALGNRRLLSRRRSLDCPHCGTGLVYTHGGIHLPPVTLECPPAVRESMPELSPSAAERSVTIELPSRPDGSWFAAVLLLLLSGVLVHYTAGWLLARLQYFPIHCFLALVATLLPAAAAVREIVEGRFERWEVQLTATSIECRRRLGPRCVRREQFPIARLLSLRACGVARSDSTASDSVEVAICCATRESRLRILPREPETTLALARLYAHVQIRAERLGRLAASPDSAPAEPKVPAASESWARNHGIRSTGVGGM